MPTASAPGKVYLFGEHAVVFGEPAIPCAIERRVTVSVEPRSDELIRIQSPSIGFSDVVIEYHDGSSRIDVSEEQVTRGVRYVDGALNQVREAADAPVMGFDVSIQSELPIGAGLGSSAAVTVATIDAALRACGITKEPRQIATMGYEVERSVQRGQASRADTFCSAIGGAVRVEGTACHEIDTMDIPFVIGYDGGSGDTSELVSAVRELRDRYSFGQEIIGSIGNVVRHGETALQDGDLDVVGRLMNIDHGLLAALGVSSRSLDAMVWTARDAGAVGAKLTGAGGGGCIVALDSNGDVGSALSITPECVSAFNAGLAKEGIRRES